MGRSGHFRWYLDALLPSVAVERMTIGRLTLVAAVAGVPQSGAVSPGTILSAPRLLESCRQGSRLAQGPGDMLFFEVPLKKGSSGIRVDESNGKYGLNPYGYWVFEVS